MVANMFDDLKAKTILKTKKGSLSYPIVYLRNMLDLSNRSFLSTIFRKIVNITNPGSFFLWQSLLEQELFYMNLPWFTETTKSSFNSSKLNSTFWTISDSSLRFWFSFEGKMCLFCMKYLHYHLIVFEAIFF